jgi:uncharacterized protein
MDIYDIGIIGSGMAGSFAAFKLSQRKDLKIIVFDMGRPPMKRRRQLDGWLGCFPNSDGKLYTNDLNKVNSISSMDKIKIANKYFNKILSNVGEFSLVHDKLPESYITNKLKTNGYSIKTNNYYQIYPKNIHMLSKYMSNEIEKQNVIDFSFDNEIKSITKEDDLFIINNGEEIIKCKKILLSVGRSGWRWANELYRQFGIIKSNNIAKFGIRIEIHSDLLKDFNKSALSMKKNNIDIGPFNWSGTVIPEDHINMAISTFRSNENRWISEKVSFPIIGNIQQTDGVEQTDRLGQLTFVLTNDRVMKEKVFYLLNDKSKISVIPEYNWIKNVINELAEIIPDITSKAYFYSPTILPFVPEINIHNNFETDIEGLFVAGECAGINGLLAAACMGILAADSIGE